MIEHMFYPKAKGSLCGHAAHRAGTSPARMSVRLPGCFLPHWTRRRSPARSIWPAEDSPCEQSEHPNCGLRAAQLAGAHLDSDCRELVKPGSSRTRLIGYDCPQLPCGACQVDIGGAGTWMT